MSIPQIIAFTAKKGNGKSTAAKIAGEILLDTYGIHSTVVSFARPIKDMLMVIGLTEDVLSDPVLKEEPHHLLCGKTPRYVQQTLGTEWARNMVHPDFWVNLARHKVVNEIQNRYVVIIDDLRFDNEADMIVDFPHVIIRLLRPDLFDGKTDTHQSERGISDKFVDETIVSCSVERLTVKMRSLLHEKFHEGC